MRFLSSKVRGFTLVEIVVVVAITGMLAMIVIANVQEARKKARDAARLSDLQQVQLALRVYKDVYGRYPAPGCPGMDPLSAQWAGLGADLQTSPYPWYFQCENYISGLIPDFIPEFPDERKVRNNLPIGVTYLYRTNSDGSEYKLLAHDIVEGGPVEPGDPFARCDLSCGPAILAELWCYQHTYSVSSPGAICW